MGNQSSKTSTRKFKHHAQHGQHRNTARKDAVGAPVSAAKAAPFNADGVVENPSIAIHRDLSKRDLIAATLYGHQIDGYWTSSAVWKLSVSPSLGDGTYPCRHGDHHATESAAFEAAGNTLIHQVEEQLGDLLTQSKWANEMSKLRKWVAKVIEDCRQTDPNLSLRGKTVIEAFAGMATATLALKADGAESILVIENDEDALAVCQRAVKPAQVHRDIRDFDGKGLDCDFLVMGPVCTGHSPSGRGDGFDDSYVNDTHQAAMRLVRDVNFKVAIVECAAELLTPKHSADFDQWLHAFMRRGCRVQHRVLDAADFGVPQSRTRSFIVAIRGDLNVDKALGFVFPTGTGRTAKVEDILQKHVRDEQHLGRIKASEVTWHREKRRSRRGLNELGRIGGKPHQGYRVYDPKAIGPTLTASGGGRAPCTGAYLIDGKVRGLTPREACRMQGLPEWFEHDSDTRRALKQAGNALAYPLFRALGTQLASVLKPRP